MKNIINIMNTFAWSTALYAGATCTCGRGRLCRSTNTLGPEHNHRGPPFKFYQKTDVGAVAAATIHATQCIQQ